MTLIATMLNERSQIQKSIGLLHLYAVKKQTGCRSHNIGYLSVEY